MFRSYLILLYINLLGACFGTEESVWKRDDKTRSVKDGEETTPSIAAKNAEFGHDFPFLSEFGYGNRPQHNPLFGYRGIREGHDGFAELYTSGNPWLVNPSSGILIAPGGPIGRPIFYNNLYGLGGNGFGQPSFSSGGSVGNFLGQAFGQRYGSGFLGQGYGGFNSGHHGGFGGGYPNILENRGALIQLHNSEQSKYGNYDLVKPSQPGFGLGSFYEFYDEPQIKNSKAKLKPEKLSSEIINNRT